MERSTDASIIITSRNRREDVLRALASCVAQEGVKFEVLVYDDGSEDGTPDAVRKMYPTCRVFQSEIRTGYIVNRNRGFQDSNSPVVISLDDDAYFSSRDTVAQVVEQFAHDESIGAIAIPYIEPLDRRSLSSLTNRFAALPGDDLRSYVGCAHAVRRSVALELGGYRDFFVHQHEEREFCLRLRARGWRVVYGEGEPIVHMVSPKREEQRTTFYGGRNQILHEVLNAPFPDVLIRVARTAVGLIRYRFSWSTLPLRLRAIGVGLADATRFRHLRNPVDRDFYRSYRKLPAHGAMKWDGEIPEPCDRISGGI